MRIIHGPLLLHRTPARLPRRERDEGRGGGAGRVDREEGRDFRGRAVPATR